MSPHPPRPQPFEEKRQHPRYEIQGLAGTLRYDMNARVLNMSLDGMALETSAWLHVGKTYRLKVGAGDDMLEVDGEIVWCHLVGNRPAAAESASPGPVYQAGIHFGETLSGQARRILSFVRRAGVIGVQTRVFGRFRIRREEAVDVAFEHPFEVRRVSLSGMLIEADLLPEVGARFALEVETRVGPFRPNVIVRSLEQSLTLAGAPTTRIGVEFHRLPEEERDLLRRLIDEQLEAGEASEVTPQVDRVPPPDTRPG